MLQCGHVVFARFDGLSAAWALPDDDSNPTPNVRDSERTRLGGLMAFGADSAPDICFAPNTNGPECGAVEPWS